MYEVVKAYGHTTMRKLGTLFEPDITPEQQRRQNSDERVGARALWKAVLLDGIAHLRRGVKVAVKVPHRYQGAAPSDREYAEVLAWVRSRAKDIRGFEGICLRLGLDAAYLREKLEDELGIDLSPGEDEMMLRGIATDFLDKYLNELPAGHQFSVRSLLPIVQNKYVDISGDTLGAALGFLKAMSGLNTPEPTVFSVWWFLTPELLLALAAGAIGSLPLVSVAGCRRDRLGGIPALGVDLAAAAALAAILLASVSQAAAGSYNPFIYFRF